MVAQQHHRLCCRAVPGRYVRICNYACRCLILSHSLAANSGLLCSQDESALKSLIQRHLKWTRSEVAHAILGDWDAAKGRFWKVFPHEYAAALRQQVSSAGFRGNSAATQTL